MGYVDEYDEHDEDDELPYLKWEREREEEEEKKRSSKRDLLGLFLIAVLLYFSCLLAVLTARLI